MALHYPFITLQFVGNVFNLYLYGALTVQLCMSFSSFIQALLTLFADSDLYYISFPTDPWLFKTVIYVIYLIETAYTILLTYGWGHSLLVDHYLPAVGVISILVCGPTGVFQFILQDAWLNVEHLKWHF
jgi:hypothetical protein